MLFLADESCDACMIRALRNSGHEVMPVADGHRGANDLTVINLAVGMSRILITEDKDFGQLVYASGHGHSGVILLRYPFQLRHHIAEQLSTLVRNRGESLSRSFTVIEPGRVRILQG
jgi:predicted nuclease of predicted toxin-antitoxin system